MFPVVLHHGLFGTGDVRLGPVTLRYFRGIDAAIRGRGHPVIVTGVHPSSSVARRAGQFRDDLFRQLKAAGLLGRRVILFGHSMGGLDVRYAVSKLGLADHVAAVVTVTSPNRGSSFADWVVHHLGRRLGVLRMIDFLGLDLRALPDLTVEASAQFNADVPDVPGIPYFSVSAARPWTRMPPFAIHSHGVIQRAEGDNDGLVSVRSSTWGEHLGVWPADHWHTINRRWVPELTNATGSIVPYWLRVLDQVVTRIAVS